MPIRRHIVDLAISTVLVMTISLLSFAPIATAETLNIRSFNHVTKFEMFPVPDVEGHLLAISVREGAVVLEGGELGWHKATLVADMLKGAGPINGYVTFTFLDGSNFTVRVQGTMQGSPKGFPATAKFTGDIIHGAGRFHGIQGTTTVSSKFLPPEKGEYGGKALGEATVSYTLPGK